MIQVAAAIIEDVEGRILIARRSLGKSQGGLWEFPGGKIEQGETPEACLVRELKEEMQIEIEPYELFGVNEHQYDTVHIQLYAYKASYKDGNITLVDHDDFCWIHGNELSHFRFAPADIAFVEALIANCQES